MKGVLDSIESGMAGAECIKNGKKLWLYKDEVVPRNCTPSYLPNFIRIEVAKRS